MSESHSTNAANNAASHTAPGQFEVWAPKGQKVRVTVDGEEHDMQPDAERAGWWVLDPATVAPQPGQHYTFSLFDGTQWSIPMPDPRTRLQPEGVHGPSEVVSTDFAWNDDNWSGIPTKDMVIYELHVGTFSPSGTFAGVIEKLDYLAELGVNTIELMPLQPFAGTRNWGYDGVDWFAVHETYGGPQGLKELIDAAHTRGIAVLLDVVYNHFGPEGNYNDEFGPYLTDGLTAWGEVINISGPGSDEVRAYILDTVRQWLGEFHADGLRLDAVQTYDDRLAFSIMEEIARIGDDLAADTGVPRTVIGESDQNDPRLISAPERGGYGLEGHWLDDLHHGIHTLLTGEKQGYYADYGTTEILADTLRNGYRFRNSFSQYRARTHGRELDLSHVAPWHLVSYTTNHDQTGNRAAGDRPSQNLTPTQQVLKAAVLLHSPFTPMLFMGEEFGADTPFPFFVSHSNEQILEGTRQGRLHEFSRQGWDHDEVPDPGNEDTYTSAKLSWTFTDEQQQVHDAYKRLIQLRREHGCNREDLRTLEVDNGEKWLTMADGSDDGTVVLAANFSDEPVTVPVGGTLLYSFTDPQVGADETVLDPWGIAYIQR